MTPNGQKFLKCVWPFWDIMHQWVKSNVQFMKMKDNLVKGNSLFLNSRIVLVLILPNSTRPALPCIFLM